MLIERATQQDKRLSVNIVARKNRPRYNRNMNAIHQLQSDANSERDRPDAAPTPALTLTSVNVSYNGNPAITNISLSFYSGERIAIIGPNGAGKSTLFKAIVGLLPVRHGSITLADGSNQPSVSSKHSVGYLQQHLDVDWTFPVSVADVVMMGRQAHIGWLRWPSSKDHASVQDALSLVGMAGHARRQIGELSGGERRRILIARALAQEANILLLDEPFAGVDTSTTEEVFAVLDNLRSEGITVLVAIHDLNMARNRFDRVLLLNQHVISYGTPQDTLVPASVNEAYGTSIGHWHEAEHIIFLSNDDCCP